MAKKPRVPYFTWGLAVPVPKFELFLLPTLKRYADGAEHRVPEMVERLSDYFQLSPEDRAEMLESKVQTRVHNRVAWAHTYLAKAGLIERVGRSRYRLSERGRTLLAEPPAELTPAFLSENYQEFRDFTKPKASPGAAIDAGESTAPADQSKTPEETLEASYTALRSALADQLIEQVKKSSPQFFERLVIDLLVSMGYGGSRSDAGRAVGQSGDGGIDGIIKEDRLGLDVVYVQAKRWEAAVGRPVVQAFVGALAGRKANKGVLITTSQFTSDALRYADTVSQKLVLIDGEQLSGYMIDFDVGVATSSTYVLKRIDLDYFDEE